MHHAPRFNRWVIPALVVAAALAPMGLMGCKLGPNYKRPEVEIQACWNQIADARFKGEPADLAEWWRTFKDPTLDALMREALDQNLTLRAASLRVVQARAARSAAIQPFFPTLTGQVSGTHSDLSENVQPGVKISKIAISIPGGVGAAGAGLLPTPEPTTLPTPEPTAQPTAAPTPGPTVGPGRLLEIAPPTVSLNPQVNLYDANVGAIWEADVWGKNRRRLEAANATVDLVYATYDNVMVLVGAELVDLYVQYRAVQNRIKALENNILEQREFVGAAEAKMTVQGHAADVYLAQTILGVNEASLPSLEALRVQLQNAMCVMLGKAPGDLELGDGPIPSAPPEVVVGIPTDLLRRRPDVRAAEAAAHAQCARVGVAKAAIMPSFSLFGSFGVRSTDSNNLFQSASIADAWGGLVGASGLLMYPFTVEAVRLENAAFVEAMLEYKQAVLVASAEVENGMIGYLKAADREAIAVKTVENAGRAAHLALEGYKSDKLPSAAPLVLAISIKSAQEDALQLTRAEIATRLISVYRALGGGWESRDNAELVPDEIKAKLKSVSEWGSFFGRRDLSTKRKRTVEP